jgi:hypothetical protein
MQNKTRPHVLMDKKRLFRQGAHGNLGLNVKLNSTA